METRYNRTVARRAWLVVADPRSIQSVLETVRNESVSTAGLLTNGEEPARSVLPASACSGVAHTP